MKMKIKIVCTHCGDYYYSERNLTEEDKEFIEIDNNGELVMVHSCHECYSKPCNEFEVPPKIIAFIGTVLPNFIITSNGVIKSIPKQTTLKIEKDGKIEIINNKELKK